MKPLTGSFLRSSTLPYARILGVLGSVLVATSACHHTPVPETYGGKTKEVGAAQQNKRSNVASAANATSATNGENSANAPRDRAPETPVASGPVSNKDSEKTKGTETTELDANKASAALAPTIQPSKPTPIAAATAAPANELQDELKSEESSVGVAYGAAGLGLSGVGQGGGGRVMAARKMASVGHGRLGGVARAYSVAPEPEFNTEGYAHVPDSKFLSVRDQPLSTFAADVDTASYSNVRRFLNSGSLPPKDAVRAEELLNYFSYAYPAPEAGQPFSVHTEVASAPWSPKHRLVQVGIKTPELKGAGVPKDLVFLIDVSGSMESPDKLPLLKRGMELLVDTLSAQDRVAIVVYAGSSGVVLPPTSGASKDVIRTALSQLEAGGSTNGGEGIELAYKLAQQNFIKGGINRVILATDGDFNVGTTSEGALTRLIEEKRKSGVFLTVLGFGQGNVKDSTMEMLADKGNGNYAYIDDLEEARKVLVREAGATLTTVAKDVKFQVEFNPARVAAYRLIGYENRRLTAEEFNDDKKDAGDMGAGHSVTALYEVIPVGEAAPGPKVDPLKYQAPTAPVASPASAELLTLKIRYKKPDGQKSEKLTVTTLDSGASFEQASTDFRFSSGVAAFAMVLGDSQSRGLATLAMAEGLAKGALGADVHGDRRNFLGMIQKARVLAKSSTAQVLRTE